MVVIENDFLKVSVNPRGAELASLYDKQAALEYMWQGDPAFWGKHSPILFPIVGTLKEDTYYYEGKPYHLSRHGFAREMNFAVSAQTESSAVFTLASTENTISKYPFHFRFDIIYSIQQRKLQVIYRVVNKGESSMFFSVGGHPAFNIPLVKNTVYDDYFLQFNALENIGKWPISKDGLIELKPEPFLIDSNRIPLTKSLFEKDALVFKGLKSTSVSLKSLKTEKGFTFDFKGFPYLGIWAAKNADFVCIEPWCGIADSTDTDQDLTQKEGINRLAANEGFERSWSIDCF